MTKKIKTYAAPVLKPIDLSKAVDSNHPDIVPGSRYYLAIINGIPYFGTFSKQWYGLNFNSGWGVSGHQFDAPGTNASDWHALWEVTGPGLKAAMRASTKTNAAQRAARTRKRKKEEEKQARKAGWSPESHYTASEFLEEYEIFGL